MSKEKNSSGVRRNRTLALLGFIVLVAVVCVALDYYKGGPEYRAAKRQCGTEPISGFTSVKRPSDKYYIIPQSELYNAPSPMYDAYFCTEEAATQANYVRWMYD